MNILILGGNGYLGSKVLAALLAESQHTIICAVRRDSSFTRIQNIENILTIPASVEAVEAITRYTTIDTVLNFACCYGKENILYSDVIEANIEYPLRILNCVTKHGCKRFLTIGTGLPDNLNMYSFSKKMFSEFGNFYAENHGIDFLNIKLQMFYGPDEPKDRFIPCLILKMLNGEDVDVTLGMQHRDIIFIDDVIKAIIAVFRSELHGYQEVSVGTGIAPTISELVDYVWQETGKLSLVKKGAVPMRPNEPDCIADNTKLCSITQWNPIGWQQGIRIMINELKEQK